MRCAMKTGIFFGKTFTPCFVFTQNAVCILQPACRTNVSAPHPKQYAPTKVLHSQQMTHAAHSLILHPVLLGSMVQADIHEWICVFALLFKNLTFSYPSLDYQAKRPSEISDGLWLDFINQMFVPHSHASVRPHCHGSHLNMGRLHVLFRSVFSLLLRSNLLR